MLSLDFNLHYQEIFVDSATKKMDNGIMHLASAWIITDTLLPTTATQSLSWMDD